MYSRNGKAVLAVILLLIAGPAYSQSKVVEEIVAWVNADIILKSELESRKEQIRTELAAPAPQGRGLSGTQLEQEFAAATKIVLRDLIDEALLLQQAKEMGFSAELEVLKAMERLRQERKHETQEALEKEIVAAGYSLDEFKQNIKTRYLTSQVIQREVYPRVTITMEEMRKYYDANVKSFDRPAGVRVRAIEIYTENRPPAEAESQRKKAEEALAAVKKGDDFAELAVKFSESASAQDGGDLGFFEKGELTPALEDVASKLEKGQTSDIITLPYGFVILKVEDKHSGGILTFDLAQRDINEMLWSQAVQPKIREYLTKLRTDGFIKVADGQVDAGAPPKTASVSEAK